MRKILKYALICIMILIVLTLGILLFNVIDRNEAGYTIDSMEKLQTHKVDIGELQEIVIINGESEHWRLNNFKVFNFDQYKITGTGTIEFLGSKEELDNMTFFFPRITVKSEEPHMEEDLCGDSYSVNNLGGTSIFTENEEGQWIYEIQRWMSNFSKNDVKTYHENVKILVEIQYKNEKHDSIKEILHAEVLVINKEIFEDIGRFGFSH
ncbi:hypothetical protein [Oceanirhabdus sp. W0125-5]|uniref:hypothetical protein n=1 Tax=Oceanirhabdus sp. W0125-5 TaxID=2999116 RepID=UPI0022F2C830|nr:hypothetical protein [Oceanirhabdus sp. W0125-5]WBW96875.1 hypothetical protein OW730_24770 [Oceanirhabdus sp. W0125-5]